MTIAKRNKIYKEAYNLIENNSKMFFMCWAISHASTGSWRDYVNVTSRKYPELFKFKPRGVFDAWFDIDETELRLTILAFCIAMTEN